MAIKCWNLELFIPSTLVGSIQTFVGDSSTTKFFTPNIPYTQIGPTLQYGTVQKFLYTGGFTKNNDDSVTIDTAPPLNSQGVVCSLSAIEIASYDTDSVANVTTPRYGYKNVYVGTDEPHVYAYNPRIGERGIECLFVNNITGLTGLPDLSFVAMACCDAAGNALSYTASGVSLWTDKMTSFSTVAASSNSGTGNLLVVSATGTDYFIAGDFIIVNIGQPTAEVIRISSISYNNLILASNFNYPHYIDESVFFYAREFSLRQVIPEGFTSNTAQNYYNLSYEVKANESQRS